MGEGLLTKVAVMLYIKIKSVNNSITKRTRFVTPGSRLGAESTPKEVGKIAGRFGAVELIGGGGTTQ